MLKPRNKKDVKAVSKFLIERITNLGITREDLAGRLKMKYGSLNAIILRNYIPRNRRAAFAKALDVMIEKLNELHGDRDGIYFERRINLMPMLKNLVLSNLSTVYTSDLNKLIGVQKHLNEPLGLETIKQLLTIK